VSLERRRLVRGRQGLEEGGRSGEERRRGFGKKGRGLGSKPLSIKETKLGTRNQKVSVERFPREKEGGTSRSERAGDLSKTGGAEKEVGKANSGKKRSGRKYGQGGAIRELKGRERRLRILIGIAGKKKAQGGTSSLMKGKKRSSGRRSAK